MTYTDISTASAPPPLLKIVQKESPPRATRGQELGWSAAPTRIARVSTGSHGPEGEPGRRGAGAGCGSARRGGEDGRRQWEVRDVSAVCILKRTGSDACAGGAIPGWMLKGNGVLKCRGTCVKKTQVT